LWQKSNNIANICPTFGFKSEKNAIFAGLKAVLDKDKTKIN
jgi:hypothetical protein